MTKRLKRAACFTGVAAVFSLMPLTGCKGGDDKAADSPEGKAQSEAAGKANASGQAEMFKKKMNQGK